MLIGISGAAGAGKDTFGEMLAKALRSHDQWVVEDRFAGNLKVSAAAALGCSVSYLEQFKRNPEMKIGFIWKGKPTHGAITVREFLQWYGTEAHRGIFGEDFWVDDLLGRHHAVGHPHLRIITDCRFRNEAEAIVGNGGRIYFLTRPDDDGIGDSHESEDFSWATDEAIAQRITHVGNLGSFEDLTEKAEEHAHQLLAPV